MTRLRWFFEIHYWQTNPFQTAIMDSPYRDTVVQDNKRQISWQSDKPNPETYTVEHWHLLTHSTAFFARKFDMSVDEKVIEALEARV